MAEIPDYPETTPSTREVLQQSTAFSQKRWGKIGSAETHCEAHAYTERNKWALRRPCEETNDTKGYLLLRMGLTSVSTDCGNLKKYLAGTFDVSRSKGANRQESLVITFGSRVTSKRGMGVF